MLINCIVTRIPEKEALSYNEIEKINCEVAGAFLDAQFSAGELVISFFLLAIFLFLVLKFIINDLN